MKRKTFLFVVIFTGLFMVFSASAQEEQPSLELNLNRNFGYGGFGKIQGRFTLKVKGADDLEKVEFLMDGVVIGEAFHPPFEYKFSTDMFEPGEHIFSARGYTGGERVSSNEIAVTILSSEQAWKETSSIFTPIMIVVAIVTLLGIGAPFLLCRGKEFQVGEYGPAGGAVCPRCQLPFSRHFLAPNLVAGKLERCPHCGKWSILPAAAGPVLRAAENRYLSENEGAALERETTGEDYRKLLEDSRFQD